MKRFAGDEQATVEKAQYLLQVARAELRELKEDESKAARARLRQAANKGWLALATAADAIRRRTGEPLVENAPGVFRTLKPRSRTAATSIDAVYSHLHIVCGYNDNPACRIPGVRASLAQAGRMIAEASAPRRRRSRRAR